MSRWLLGAILVSAWMTWSAYQGPPQSDPHAAPPPLPRAVSDEDKSELIELAGAITKRIQAAQATRGQPIPTSSLEDVDETGRPYLEHPIPDNPLMPGIASIQEACPAAGQTTAHDWVHCPQTGVLVAVIDGQSVSGKE